MIPSTFEAVVIAVLFVVPGLLFEFGIEREIDFWRTNIPDRVLRFFTLSVLLHVALAPIDWQVWVHYVRGSPRRASHSTTPPLLAHHAAPWPLWGYFALVTIVPFLLGNLVGRHYHNKTDLLTDLVIGRDVAPQAWDFLFDDPWLVAFVRVYVTKGEWLAGVFIGQAVTRKRKVKKHFPYLGSYAASYPDPSDLYLSVQVCTDHRGNLATVGEDRARHVQPWGVLIRRDQIQRVRVQVISHGKDIRPELTSEGGLGKLLKQWDEEHEVECSLIAAGDSSSQ